MELPHLIRRCEADVRLREDARFGFLAMSVSWTSSSGLQVVIFVLNK